MFDEFVYGNLHLDEVTEHPDIDGMVEAIRIMTCTASRTAWEMCWNP